MAVIEEQTAPIVGRVRPAGSCTSPQRFVARILGDPERIETTIGHRGSRYTRQSRALDRRRPTAKRRSRVSAWLRQWDSAITSYYLVIGATALLLGLGLVMVLSSSAVESIAAGRSPYAQFRNQARFAIFGLIVLLLAAHVPPAWYRRLTVPALFGSVALQSLTMVPGIAVHKGGNTGWIRLGGLTMQPAEVGKIALCLWLGLALGRRVEQGKTIREVLPLAVAGSGLIIGMILVGKDLGTAIVTFLILAGALWVAGIPARTMAIGGGLGGAAVLWLFIFAQENSNRLNRIFATYGSACDAAGSCYQNLHGKYALGTGGVFGVGLGASREKWRYLPEAQNDFIFAIIGEELGLLGCLLILALFIVLGYAMVRIVKRSDDPFVVITTASVATWVVGQAFINIGVVLGLLPVIGLPLPLVSAGGSALVTTLGALGMIISFARSEPGAAEALAARGSVVRRSFAVISRVRPSKVTA